jgi:POT family proton-dependent oligopeptide transporter
MYFCYKHLFKAPPQGSVTLEAFKVVKTVFAKGGLRAAFRGGDAFWNLAKPSFIEESEGTIDRSKIFWDDTFVDEIRQSIAACGVFVLIPIFNLGKFNFSS